MANRYVQSTTNGRVHVANKELLERKDMREISEDLALKLVNGDNPQPAVSAPAEPAPAPSTNAPSETNQTAADAFEEAMGAALAQVEACTDKAELEQIGRAYDYEADRRHGIERVRKEVKEAIVAWSAAQRDQAGKK